MEVREPNCVPVFIIIIISCFRRSCYSSCSYFTTHRDHESSSGCQRWLNFWRASIGVKALYTPLWNWTMLTKTTAPESLIKTRNEFTLHQTSWNAQKVSSYFIRYLIKKSNIIHHILEYYSVRVSQVVVIYPLWRNQGLRVCLCLFLWCSWMKTLSLSQRVLKLHTVWTAERTVL